MVECMLTTFDNPYDPFDQYDDWLQFDLEAGYSTNSYLARIAMLSEALSDKETSDEIERAIDEIIKYDFRNIYKKVKRDIKEDDRNYEKETRLLEEQLKLH
jgi:hypothetical protein